MSLESLHGSSPAAILKARNAETREKTAGRESEAGRLEQERWYVLDRVVDPYAQSHYSERVFA